MSFRNVNCAFSALHNQKATQIISCCSLKKNIYSKFKRSIMFFFLNLLNITKQTFSMSP